MASLNIGRDNADASFRYKMPRMQSKIEGRGNGIKTVILNMPEVAKALNIDPDYPTKFFGTELGSISKFDKKLSRAIVNGAHDGGKLSELLNKFIDIFILCPKCRLPEIIWQVDEKKGDIRVDCAACGNNSLLNHTHKLVSYILKNPPAKQKKLSGKKPKKGDDEEDGSGDEQEQEDDEVGQGHHAHIASRALNQTEALKSLSKKGSSNEDDIEWSEDSSKEAQRLRRQAELKAMGVDTELSARAQSALSLKDKDLTPAGVLRQFIQQGDKTAQQIAAELRRIALARGLEDPAKYLLLLEAILDVTQPKTFTQQIKEQAPLIKKLAADKVQRAILFGAFEQLIGQVSPSTLMPRVPLILQALYETDLYDEDFIVCWFDSPPESSLTIKRDAAIEMRKLSEKFVDWLKQPDSDDEEDSEEEDSDDD